MGFGVEGFLGVEGRFFYTVVFETVASTASLAFFYGGFNVQVQHDRIYRFSTFRVRSPSEGKSRLHADGLGRGLDQHAVIHREAITLFLMQYSLVKVLHLELERAKC